MGLIITDSQLDLITTSHKMQAMWTVIMTVCIVGGSAMTPLLIMAPWRVGGWWIAVICGGVIANQLRLGWRKTRERVCGHIRRYQHEEGP